MTDRTSEDRVVLVDANDLQIGLAEKQAVHEDGRLHRAISVQIFDVAGRLLLQRRNRQKYHSGGLWTNTCCSHPRPDETPHAAAERRLFEEMGIRTALRHLFSTTYRAVVGDGLIEHELVHVFGGRYDGAVRPDPAEVEAFKWILPEDLRKSLECEPQKYSQWFQIYLRDHWDEMAVMPVSLDNAQISER